MAKAIYWYLTRQLLAQAVASVSAMTPEAEKMWPYHVSISKEMAKYQNSAGLSLWCVAGEAM